MNHEIDFSPDDIYIKECSSVFSVVSLFPTTKKKKRKEKQGKTLYRMQVNSVLSSCLEKRPLQTSCLSEALTSSALIALTGSSRLFISLFFHGIIVVIDLKEIEALRCDLFRWQWLRQTPKEYEGCVGVGVCVLLNKFSKWHKLAGVNYVCFSKHSCHLYIDACSRAGQLVTSLLLHSAWS